MFRRLLVTLSLAAALAGPAAAALIGNGPPDLSGGTDLNANLGADNFMLAGDSTINLIRFWAAQDAAAAYAGSIEYSFRTDSGGTPGASVQSGTTAFTQVSTAQVVFGLPLFLYEASVNIDLGAGDYWLVLHNGPSSSPLTTEFYWAHSDSDGGDGQAYELATATWGTVSAELAFELDATPRNGNPVPEPGSLALFAAGVAILATRRIRRS